MYLRKNYSGGVVTAKYHALNVIYCKVPTSKTSKSKKKKKCKAEFQSYFVRWETMWY